MELRGMNDRIRKLRKQSEEILLSLKIPAFVRKCKKMKLTNY